MKMKETDFLELLESRAKEIHWIHESGILPDWASFLGRWLGENPWRVLGLAATVIYGLGRWWLGENWREGILAIFGGF